MQVSNFIDDDLSFNKNGWTFPINDNYSIDKNHLQLSQILDIQNNRKTIILNIILYNSLKLKLGIICNILSKFSIRQIIDLSLCLRYGGVEFVILIHKNKYNKKNHINLLMDTVKYYEKNLHGYIDLVLIHYNNIINITETNCKLNKYLHQLSSSSREHEQDDGGGTIEALVPEAASGDVGDDDNDDDDDIVSTAITKVLPVVVLSDSKQDNKIGVISISRRKNSTTIEANILNDSK
jgi:hypothetical protein